MSFDNENWKQEWTTGEVITANKLNALKDAVVRIDGTVTNINTTVTDHSGNINSINNTIDNIETNVNNIASEIENARNYGSSTSGSLGTRIDELVQVSATQPTGNNEIWVSSANEEVSVPTYEEFTGLSAALNKCFTADGTIPEQIPAKSDFDDYSTPGNYKVANSTVAESLLHRPSDSAGRLFVLQQVNTARRLQIYFDISGNIYIRRYTTAWAENWDKIQYELNFDNTPTQNSVNPVTSGGIYTALQNYFAAPYGLPAGTTALSSLSQTGYYHISVSDSSFADLTDLPNWLVSVNGHAFLLNYVYSTGNKIQILMQISAGLMWCRTITTSEGTTTVGNWVEQKTARALRRVEDGDADLIAYTGFYHWGSSDSTIAHVPNNESAGMIVHVQRDNNTKYQIGIGYSNHDIYIRQCTNIGWSEWDRLAYASEIPTLPPEPLKPLIRYDTGTTYDQSKASKRLRIYLPFKDHYLCYQFYYYDLDTITTPKCNCWRIYGMYWVPADLSTTIAITSTGEWECALRLNGDEFVGGSTHGYEQMTGYEIFIDGKKITNDLSNYASKETPFTTFRLVRSSNIYRQNTETIIAEHGCEYVFDGSTTMKINQSIKWKGAYKVKNCFLAMFTPHKNCTDYGYTDVDFIPYHFPNETQDGYNKYYNSAKKAFLYGTYDAYNINYTAEFYVERYPLLETGNLFKFTNNSSSQSYNKCYFYVTSSEQPSGESLSENQLYTTSIDELWQSTSVYKVEA